MHCETRAGPEPQATLVPLHSRNGRGCEGGLELKWRSHEFFHTTVALLSDAWEKELVRLEATWQLEALSPKLKFHARCKSGDSELLASQKSLEWRGAYAGTRWTARRTRTRNTGLSRNALQLVTWCQILQRETSSSSDRDNP